MQVGLFIHTQHQLLLGQGASVQLDQDADQMSKVSITGHFGGKLEMVSPRFELMRAQNPPNGLRRNGLNDAIGFQLPGKFRTIPLRE